MGKLLMLTNGGEGITRGMDAGVLATKCKYTTLWNAVPEHTPTDRDTLYVQIHTLNHIHKTNTQQTFIHKHATLENMPHTHTHSPTLKQNTHTKTNTHIHTHTPTKTQTITHTHTHTHTNIHKYTNKHTH